MTFDALFVVANHIDIRLTLGVDEVISAKKCVTKDPKRNF